jgi:hypothetical protein
MRYATAYILSRIPPPPEVSLFSNHRRRLKNARKDHDWVTHRSHRVLQWGAVNGREHFKHISGPYLEACGQPPTPSHTSFKNLLQYYTVSMSL